MLSFLCLHNGIRIFLLQGTACSLQVFNLDEIQVKVAHPVQHFAFTQLTSGGTISAATNTLFSEEFFGLGTWLKMTPPPPKKKLLCNLWLRGGTYMPSASP